MRNLYRTVSAQALAMDENNAQILDADLCFGCGMCATGCPEGAILMEAKPDFPAPPRTIKDLVAALRSCAEGKS